MSEENSGGCLKKIFIGLGILIISTVLILYLSWGFLKEKGLELAADMSQKMTQQILDESYLTDEERSGVQQEFIRITDLMKSGELDGKQLERIGKTFEDGKLISYFGIINFSRKYTSQSGLTEENKEKATRLFERLLRGISTDQVTKTEMEKLSQLIPVKEGEQGQKTLKETISDEEFNAIIDRVKEIVESKNIIDETFHLDIVAETRKVLDEALLEEPSLN